MRGGLVIDFHGMVCPRILALLPDDFPPEKVMYINLSDPQRIFKYNICNIGHAHPELWVDHLVDGIRLLFSTSEWGGLIEDDLRACLYPLVVEPGLCLGDLSALVSRTAAGRRLVEQILPKIKNQEIRKVWEDHLRANTPRLGRSFPKLRPFLTSMAGRSFCLAENVLDFSRCMHDGIWVFADLAIGTLGAATAELMASILCSQAFYARMNRYNRGEKLEPWGLYVDEAHRLSGNVMELLCVNQRKLDIAMVMGYQSRDLFGTRGRIALRNVGTVISLNLHYEDASEIARESAGILDAKALQRLPVGAGWASIDNEFVPLKLLPPRLPPKDADGRRFIEYSLRNYYFTEEEYAISAKHRAGEATVPANSSRKRGYDMI